MEDVFENTTAVGASIVAGSVKEIYYKESFGVVHSSSNSKVNSDTLFDIQSITKVVATTSLLERFVTEGLIHLSDQVQKYIPEIKGSYKSKITIKDLVLHQSGISDEDFGGSFNSVNDLWNSMFNSEVRFEPGTATEYTDVGYRLLGLCLERVGGANLDLLCAKHIWLPLGMNQTTYDIARVAKTKIAGHGETWGMVDDAQDRFLGGTLGCDGVFSSSTDLSIFCRSLLKRLDDKKYLQHFTKLGAGDLDESWSFYESLGLGRKVYGWEAHHMNQSYLGLAHTSLSVEKAGGAGAFICVRPEYQDFFIYLTNHGRPEPFSMEAWNNLVAKLKVRELSREILKS